MSYQISFEDNYVKYNYVNARIDGWLTNLSDVSKQIQRIIDSDSFQGAAADAVKCYLSEVHGSIFSLFEQLVKEFMAYFLLYVDEYHQIDTDVSAELIEETFHDITRKFEQTGKDFITINSTLNSELRKVMHIVYIKAASDEEVTACYDALINSTRELREDVQQHEEEYAKGYDNIETLISELQTIIQYYRDNAQTIQYQPQQIGAVGNAQARRDAMEASALFLAGIDGLIGQAIQNNQAWTDDYQKLLKKWQKEEELELADQRTKDGIQQIILGIGMVAVGVVAIVGTAGMAAPGVVVGGIYVSGTAISAASYITAGSVAAYGVSETIEGSVNVYYGTHGEAYKAAFNPIRDTVFMGHQNLYDMWGLGSQIVSGEVSRLVAMGSTKKSIREYLTWNDYQKEKGLTSEEASKLYHQYKKDHPESYYTYETQKPSKPAGTEVHHFASNKNSEFTKQFKDITDDYGLDLDGDWNKEDISPHRGGHAKAYNEFVLKQMNDIDQVAQGNKELFLALYETEVKDVIRANPEMMYADYWKNKG